MGVVVVIGNELLWCADNGKMNAHAGKASLEPVGDIRIGDVLAVPSQQEVHFVNSRSGQMRGVADSGRRQDTAANQFAGESLHLLVEVQKFEPRQRLEPFGCLAGFALASLVENKLRREAFELAALSVPPD